MKPNPRRAASILFCLTILAPAARAGEVSAVVIARSPQAMERGHVICQHRIEGSLRQMGFSILDNRRDPCEAGLVIVIGRDQARQKRTVPTAFEQPVHLHMIRPEGPVAGEEDCRSGRIMGQNLADLDLLGSSRANWTGALQDACRELDREIQERARQAMGAMLQTRVKTTLTLRWQGRLQPMPLLLTTPYLRDFLGVPPELISSDDQHCRYEFHLDDPHGIFKERTQAFLQKHWSIQATSGDPGKGSQQLEFHLAKKTEP